MLVSGGRYKSIVLSHRSPWPRPPCACAVATLIPTAANLCTQGVSHMHWLESQRSRVDTIDRNSLLTQKKVETKDKRLTFVSTYNTLSTQINNVIKKEWRILGDTLPTIPEFRNPPCMAFKWARNLKDNLCGADIGPK